MAEKFGKTWWGEAWLNSLSNIDYENRIPRGASYARRGMVRKLTRNGNVIEAKVAGSRPTPYKELIVVPKFSEEDKTLLINKILQRPALITQLLNRKLMPEMLQVANECGLKIFPEKWTDLKMNCNCPDWAVPCKHLAAVVYMISKEIDNNPFIVFEMHGVDILDELQKRGLNIKEALENAEVPTAKDVITTASSSKEKKNTENNPRKPTKTKKADFSSLSDQTEAILKVLPDNPPFYESGDFKEVYAKELNHIAKNAKRCLAKKIDIVALFPAYNKLATEIITIDSEPTLTVDDKIKWEAADPSNPKLNILDLASALWEINPDFLPDYHLNIKILHECLMAALHFAANGLIVPKIIKTAEKKYTIQWFPATHDLNVEKIIADISWEMPDGILNTRRGKKTYAVADSAEWIISFFLTTMVMNISHSTVFSPVYLLFFKDAELDFKEIGQKEIPGAIKSWIDYSRLTESLWTPVITVDQSDDVDTEEDYADYSDNNQETFNLSIGLQRRDNLSMPVVPLKDIMTQQTYETDRFDILKIVSQLAIVMPSVSKYIDSYAENPIEYTLEDLPQLLLDVVPAIRLLGIKVYLPKALQKLLKPKPSLSINKREEEQNAMFHLFDMFEYDWRVSIGDTIITPKEFDQLTANASGLIRFKKTYFYIKPDELARLRKSLIYPQKLSSIDIFKAAISGTYEKSPILLSKEARELIDEFRKTDNVETPHGLNATLRPYQHRGYSWLYKNMRLGFGSILADDMGLGKTLQTIALIQKMKEENILTHNALIIVPVGLISNWGEEFKKFAPQITVGVYHGAGRAIDKKITVDVVITSYGVARSDAAKLNKHKWQLVIIDEAQNIKNQKTAQTKAVSSINADTHIALSGTPVENRLSEFWSIMNFANKGYLGSLKDFSSTYAQPIQINNDEVCASLFKKITSPFMMRRMKTDKSIISDLPDKIEQNIYASLSKEQAALYKKTLDEAMAVIEGLPTDSQKALFVRQGIILQMILSLKQICNHPAQFLKNSDYKAELSGKAMLLLDRVESIVESNNKVLIFTQFTEMGKILVDLLEERLGKKPLFYHGGCSISQRQEMVDRFQTRNSDKVFVLSLKAAGTGLNLTAASHVIHYDLWWNPAVEAQATDRAYRIGQHNNVLVDRFITRGTFEEKIDEMINSKKHLAEMTVATGENWIGHLSNTELKELFG